MEFSKVDRSRLASYEQSADPSGTADNSVRDNIQYQTSESYTCTKCQKSALKGQDNICWFVNLSQPQDSRPEPTLQYALRLSMQRDQRELHCEKYQHDEFSVTTKISKLPNTLIIQLNRYKFVGNESKKFHTSIKISKFVTLQEYAAEKVVPPPTRAPCIYKRTPYDPSGPPVTATGRSVIHPGPL